MIVERQGLIVWFQHMKNIKHIKRYGHLIHVSRKLKYAVLYVDRDKIEDVENRIMKHSFVSKVDRSYKPDVRTDYEQTHPEEKKSKEYDYKMGI